MTKRKAIKETLAHWKRMIEWAEYQPKNKYVNDYMMLEEIEEDWSSDFCFLCKKYIILHNSCDLCPLTKKYGKCNYFIRDKKNKNKWHKVHSSTTWKEWVKNAKEFYKQIESLL